MSATNPFHQKTVVVSGATKGIGRAVVEKFAAAGANIAFCARSQADVYALELELQQRYPQQLFLGRVVDMGVKAQVLAFADHILQFSGQVDVLVNNAGLFEPGSIHTEADGVLEKLTETNVYSAYHLSRALLPGMMLRKSGHIFNICSTASITAYTNGGSYCITKFALLGMTKVLREELKPYAIKVTAVLPGATYTHSWSASDLPESRFMQAADVADTIYAAATLSPSAVIEEILMRPMEGDID